jgi:hypothetical protein
MVRWYHATISAYGFWLPNDPRGSWSDFVAAYELYRCGGPATKTAERRSLAHDRHDAVVRRETKRHLMYPPVRFDDAQRQAIIDGFGRASAEGDIEVLAGCIGFDHGHVTVARHPSKTIEQIVGHLKSRATQAFTAAGCHPLAAYADAAGAVPTPWAGGCWKVFIDDPVQMRAAVEYDRRHAAKEGLPEQVWPFVRPIV